MVDFGSFLQILILWIQVGIFDIPKFPRLLFTKWMKCEVCILILLLTVYCKFIAGKEEFDRQCEGCAFGKQHRNSFPKKSEHESSQPLELIHTDVCGPMCIDSV